MNKILFVICLSIMVVSCYKDLSTEALNEIPELIVTGPEGDITIPYGQTLEIEVKATQKGRGTKDFTFVWEMDVTPQNENSRIEVGRGSNLKMRIANTPSDFPYILTCSVTDTKTGLSVIKGWKIYVSTSLGDGLLVAHTRDGGQTSDFDLVSNSGVTYGKTSIEPFYVRDLYSLSNDGQKIEGRINAMVPYFASTTSSWSENNIAVGTDRSLFLIDPLTYTKTRKDHELFSIYDGAEFNVSKLFNAGGWATFALMNDGRLYGTIGLISNKYGSAVISKDLQTMFKRSNVAYAMQSQGDFCVFNDENSTFYYEQNAGMFHQNAFVAISEPNLSFSLKGAKSLAGGCVKGANELCLAHLLKSAAGTYHVCVWNLEPNEPELFGQYDLDGAGLDNAVSFAFCDNADLMYYATEQNIYAVLLAAGQSYTSKLSWTPDSKDEKIRSIEQYYQAWYGTHNYLKPYTYEFQIPSNRLQLIITTYNEKTGEGKVYLRPFNVSTGRFTSQSNGTFGGFGEITAVTSTLK